MLDGQYVCLASGGSSGVRGVFVQTAEEYAEDWDLDGLMTALSAIYPVSLPAGSATDVAGAAAESVAFQQRGDFSHDSASHKFRDSLI